NGLVVDGIVGPQTLAAMYQALTSASDLVVPTTALRQGDKGDDVALLQDLLASAGQSPGASDGVFGPLTQQAVIEFQTAADLLVDGIVGQQTWTALVAS
ncbi:MAG: peptidoglycan-binding protein, partial [Acidimicrobiia bacterium]|nr:peptidoglycan-binding protein [Acidimicrobiia bacterium]